MKTVMIGDRRFRLPFLDLIPFDDEQNAQLGRTINEAGRVYVPIVGWKEKSTSAEVWVIDGAHRVLWCAEHKVGPPRVILESFDSEEEAADRCREINLERRHLAPTQREPLRLERIERVAKRRQEGESLRAIADAEKISRTQVSSDLDAATVNLGCPVVPKDGVIVGKDGRKRKDTTIFCKRCKRLGRAVKDCQQCERARKDAAKKKAAAKQRKADEAEKVDCFKNPVPAKRQDALFDPWIEKAIDFLAETSESFRTERLMDQMRKKAKHYPFFDPKDFIDGCGFVIQYLDSLIEHLKENRPAAVCPKCTGDGCGKCKMSGLVPRALYTEAKK